MRAANLKLSLFGPGSLTLDAKGVRLHSAKALALLAFLVVEADRPHSRARLAGLLWGNRSDAGRQSLRQALYSLKTVAEGALQDCLVTDRELVKFVAQPGVEVDVHRWLAGADGVAPPEFLEGMAFEDCEEFEAWLTATRARFRALAARHSGAPRQERDGLPADAGEAEPLVRAARAAERVYALGNALELYDHALGVLRAAAPAAPERYAEVLLLKEAVLERLGRRAEQVATIGETIAVVESLGDPARLATVLLRQAGACAYLGNSAEAVGAARRALEIYRGIPDRPGEAEALRELGFAHWRANDYAAALHFARQALELHRRLGDVAGEASALHNLAEIHRGLGSPRQALEWYEQALQLHWSARSHEGEILTLFGMANALQQAGDLAASRQKYEQALDLSARHGERTMQSRALHALAMQSAAQMDLEAGLDLMRRAVDVDRAIGYAHALGHDLLDLAHLHWLRGERVEARAAVQEALVWFRYTEDGDALATARAQLQNIDNGTAMAVPGRRQWVKSHLALGEGKVYCEFESPLGGMRHRGA